MARLLKTRDYTNSELLEITIEMSLVAKYDFKQCYSTKDRENNMIKQKYYEQVGRILFRNITIEESKDNKADQGGLF